jgi:cell division septation protein DedD
LASSAAANQGERDVEAPDVFAVKEEGLWDGRPSLGGVWVAFPDVKDPERVIIRNAATGKSVIGALFRRERDNPGPKLQLSSDTAEALGIVAGQPTVLDVVALRKEAAPIIPDTPVIAETTTSEGALPGATPIEASTLEASAEPADPIKAAQAAIEKSESLAPASGSTTAAASATTPVAATPAPAAPKPVRTAKASPLAKPFIQIGIFSVKGNADNTATSLRGIGIIPEVKEQTSQGKRFWRVLVGPATTSGERAALLKKVKGLGFGDAYFVTN